jgi:hypothetical protein
MMPDWNADPDNYAFQKRLRRETGLTPWGEAYKWRRRFWAALALAAAGWLLFFLAKG